MELYSRPKVWVNWLDPTRPRLVMIWITPVEASAPYNVAAAGPFTSSMDSMSSGSMSCRRSYICPPVKNTAPPPVATRTPSTYSSGSLLSEIDDTPRTRIWLEVPDDPDALSIETPATLD